VSLVVRTLADRYAEVGDVLAGHLADDPSWGCQLVVRTDEGVVVDLTSDSEADDPLHVVASVTKGVAGVTVALALQSAGVDPGERVAALWPEFAVEGKSAVTLAQLLSHQVGLLATTRDFTVAQWGEDRTVAADLAAQRPLWAPGRVHGYHALTIGPLADELVRRLTGLPLWRFYEDQVRAPLEADFWVRLPDTQSGRLRDVVVPPPAGPPAVGDGGLTERGTGQLEAMGPGTTWINAPGLAAAGIPSVSGAGTAAGLAAVYAGALGLGGRPALLTPATTAAVSQLQVAGPDLVLGGETRFGVLFQKPDPVKDFGTAAAFGHDGAGGALGFADPGTRTAFGFTTSTVPVPGGADRRALEVARLVRRIGLARPRNVGRLAAS